MIVVQFTVYIHMVFFTGLDNLMKLFYWYTSNLEKQWNIYEDYSQKAPTNIYY